MRAFVGSLLRRQPSGIVLTLPPSELLTENTAYLPGGNDTSFKSAPMATSKVYPPPSSAHRGCDTYNQHYLPVQRQQYGKPRSISSVDDVQAQTLLLEYLNDTKKSLQHVSESLITHGDVILARWKEYGGDARAELLCKASDSLFPDLSDYESIAKQQDLELDREKTRGLVPWLEVTSFSQDFMKLLSLLHVRTEYGPEQWATFNTRSSYYAFSEDTAQAYLHNAQAVVMHSDRYGILTKFDVNSAHGWETAGFPRAILTFQAQNDIAAMLSAAVNFIVGDAKPSGSLEWNTLVSSGLRSAYHDVLWSSYHHQELAPPSKFDPDVLLEKAQNHLNSLVDDMELMQTSPEQMRQYVLDVKASTWFYYEGSRSTEQEWTSIAQNMAAGWTNELCRWQRIVAECEHLKETLARTGMNVEPGTRLNKIADAAMRCFGATLSSLLKEIVVRHTLPSLKTISMMRASLKRIGKVGDLNLSQKGDRVKHLMGSLGLYRIGDHQDGISWHLGKLKVELEGVTYSKSVEHWLSGMALLDDLCDSWRWRQMTDYHDPLDRKALLREIRSRDELPSNFSFSNERTIAAMAPKAGGNEWTTGEKLGGQLLRTFCERAIPKGTRNRSWLKKMEESRMRLSKYWNWVRDTWNQKQGSVGRSESFMAQILSRISFDVGPKHLAEVDTERQRILDDMKDANAVGAQQRSRPQFMRQPWDTGAGEDGAVRRNLTKKSTASRNDASIDDGLQSLDLGDETEAETDSIDRQPNSIKQIAVKQVTLSLVSKMFPTGAEDSSSVRWTHLVQALEDAGMIATQGAGSAVVFRNQHGSISFHEPHPEPTVHAIKLRGFGQRLAKWFGWENETFVLRPKAHGEVQDGGPE